MEKYVDALLIEMHLYEPLLSAAPIETVFLGGGTPSWLPEALLERVFNTLRSLSDYKPIEVTLEANPEDITAEKVAFWKGIGITRLSVGVQSFSSKVLATLGRWHRPEHAQKAVATIAKADFSSWSVDLIFGVPGQYTKEIQADLDFLLSLNIPHISTYGLTIEPRTVLYKKFKRGHFKNISDDIFAEQYLFIHSYLESRGFTWYEISNWAREGFESHHNWRYWTRRPYIGLGPSAHSYIPERRWSNVDKLNLYISSLLDQRKLPIAFEETLTPDQISLEKTMTYLRTRIGIPKEWIISDKSYKYIDKKMLTERNGRLSLRPQGALLIDSILSEI
jgi:oxygen-independent coproporphyrinogen-3 oxidase